jgi:hypothetical protein
LFALVAFSTTIVNTASQPVNMRVVGAMAAATPTGTPSGGATPSPTPTSTPVDPSTIAGLNLWLKADAITGVADGAPMYSGWPDSSGQAHDFAAYVGYPIFKQNFLNGKPVVGFSGTNQFLTNTTAALISGQCTVIAVVSFDAAAAGAHSYFSSGGGASNNIAMTIGSNGADLVHNHFASGWASATDIGGVVPNAFNIVTADWNGSNIHLWRNGALKATTGATTFGNTATTTRLGLDDLSQTFAGNLAEVLIYSRALSDPERHAVDSYLSTKYGITVTQGLRDLLLERVKEKQ